MARKPLRSQLNQIRAWVREGRTDAWIAHQLEIPAAELHEFKRRHGLTADGGEADEDLRDEIEAEIEAATREAEEEEEEEQEEEAEADQEEEAVGEAIAGRAEVTQAGEPEEAVAAEEDRAERAPGASAESQDEPAEGVPRRRRRRRRRGRGGRGGPKTLQATFDHGDSDGFGLWLDPAVQDESVYAEHWAGHREVEV
jgi:hypothetical protein